MIITAEQAAEILRGRPIQDWSDRPLLLRVFRRLEKPNEILFWADFKRPYAVLMSKEEKILAGCIANTQNGKEWLEKYEVWIQSKGGDDKCHVEEKATADGVRPPELGM